MNERNRHALDNSKPLEMLFGHILTCEPKKSIQIIQQMDSAWCKNPFHKRVLEAMQQLVSSKKPVDLLTLTTQFRENGWMEKSVVVRISQLTNHVNGFDARIHLDSLVHELQLFESVIRATSFRNQFDQLIESDSMTIEKYNEIVDGLKRVDFDFNKQSKTNPELMFDIMVDHENAKAGSISGLDLKYQCLKNVVLLEPCDMMVVGARPAMGKTAFAISTMVQLANAGKNVVFFSLEMSTKQIMRRIMANISGYNSNWIKYGYLTNEQLRDLATWQQWNGWNHITIFDGTHSVNQIAAKLHETQRTKPTDVFVVDYLQKIQPKNNRSRYESVTEISNGIKLISQNMSIPSIALAQLSRDSSKTGKRPSLPDLKESGEIEQDASVVAFLHRPEYYGETETINGGSSHNVCELIIGKNREGELGIHEMSVHLELSKFNG